MFNKIIGKNKHFEARVYKIGLENKQYSGNPKKILKFT